MSFGRDLVYGRASSRWLRTKGVLLDTSGHPGTAGPHDSLAQITYEYTVDRTTYVSRRIDYAGAGFGTDAGNVLLRYRGRLAVPVYFDPSHPARSVLEPGLKSGNFLRLALALTFLGSGVAALVAAYR